VDEFYDTEKLFFKRLAPFTKMIQRKASPKEFMNWSISFFLW
jgi:hypothetical protein